MTSKRTEIKKEIAYAETRCNELKEQLQALEAKLEEEESRLANTSGGKQALANELKEVQKLLKRYTDQLDHLKTHDSIAVKFVMALCLIVFLVWMLVVLTDNWGKTAQDFDINVQEIFK